MAQLRAYAEMYLPVRSQMRKEFLLDVSDLEDPDFSRSEKKEVVKRMWRSWGSVLGWKTMDGS